MDIAERRFYQSAMHATASELPESAYSDWTIGMRVMERDRISSHRLKQLHPIEPLRDGDFPSSRTGWPAGKQ